jgi:hypothetical protein
MMPTSMMISNLMAAPVRRRGSGCSDGRRGGVGGRGGGGVRRIYHLSSMLTVLAFSARLGGCLRKSERLRYNMTVYPEVRVYADPFEGLTVQLSELRGLIKIVPPLIEADRERRWQEIGSRPGDPDSPDMIDIYEEEAGLEEGWGHADFPRTIYVAAVVTAWAVFHDYLARELRKSLDHDLSQHPPLAKPAAKQVREWDRRFETLEKGYRDFAGIPVAEWSTWDEVRHARELRNALVHNQGQYTRAYLKTKLARRPTEEELPFALVDDDSALIDREVIPLSFTLTDAAITQLLAAATEVREAIDQAPRN